MLKLFVDQDKIFTKEEYAKGHRKRLIKKFLTHSENFNKSDILEIILFLTIPRKDTKTIAKNLDNIYPDLLSLCSAETEELQRINGLGENSILFIKLIYELALRISQEKLQKKDCLNCFNDLINYCKLNLGTKKHEELRVIFLTVKNTIIKDELLFKGTLSAVNVYPREIVKKSLDLGAAKLILVHNHPSGDPSPSSEDVELTKNIQKILKNINIELLDHLVIGGSSFISFRTNKISPFDC